MLKLQQKFLCKMNRETIDLNHTLTVPSLDCFRRWRRLRTLRHICGKLDGFPGPNKRENRKTLSGRKSGNNSRTSTFAYFDGSIAASGVSNFLSGAFESDLLSSSQLSERAASWLNKILEKMFQKFQIYVTYLSCDFNGRLGGGIRSLSLDVIWGAEK